MRRAYSTVKMVTEMNSMRIRMRKSQSGILNVQMKTERTLNTISTMIVPSKMPLTTRRRPVTSAEGWITSKTPRLMRW